MRAELSAGKTMGTFYWRRLLRIAPAYFVFAGIALAAQSRRDPAQLAVGFHRNGELADRMARSMAADDLASVVDLRAGAILFVLAASYFAVSAQMDAVRNHHGCVGRHRVSNRLRDLFSADHCSMGVAIRQPRLARRRRSAGLVWRTTESIARRLGAWRGSVCRC